MTIEEAGEVILIGQAYIACSSCEVKFRHDCRHCNGFGTLTSPDYLRACQILGLEEPLPFDEAILDQRWLGGR